MGNHQCGEGQAAHPVPGLIVGRGHAHALYIHEHSPLHRLAPQLKLAGVIVFVVSVAITPREEVWAFALYAAILGLVVILARVPLRFLVVRLAAILPFILFALLIPFIAGGERVDLLWFSISRDGLWSTWNIVAKATLGATASIVLVATTDVPDILRGMSALRVPSLLMAITGFMVRYLELIVAELGRMRVAMISRGYSPRWLSQARPIAASAGAMFVRSYERGERVHSAMVARGYSGVMPQLSGERPSPRSWIIAMALPLLAVGVAIRSLI